MDLFKQEISKKNKVAMIGTLPPIGGLTLYCLELVNSISKHIFVEFINFKKLYPDFLYPGRDIGDNTYKSFTITDGTIRNILTYYNPLTWIWAGFTIKSKIVHAQWWSHVLAPVYFVVLAICKFRGKKIIITVHNVLPHAALPYENKRLNKFLNGVVLYLGDIFIVHSTRNIEELHDIFGIPKGKIVRIPIGTSTLFKDSIVTKEDAREELGLSLEGKIILFFGTIREYKGLDILLEAFSYVTKERGDVFLVIAGSLWGKSEKYRELIKMENLNKNIKLFIEFIPSDKVKYFYYASDLVVLPYREFMSQSAAGADALAFEKPLIVTDVGGLPELVKDKKFVVEQNNPRALAEKILLALGDDELLKKLSADSRDLAEEYSWDKVGEKTVGLYRCVIRGEQI